MLRALALALLVAVASYLVGAFAGGWLLSVLSTNTHDRSVEAAMTGAFVCGPLAAIVGFTAAVVVLRGRRRHRATSTEAPPSPPPSRG